MSLEKPLSKPAGQKEKSNVFLGMLEKNRGFLKLAPILLSLRGMRWKPPSSPPSFEACAPFPKAERGFSLIETLIAAALFLGVVIGVLPLIDRSQKNNEAGRIASRMVTESTRILETHLALPFNAEPLTIPGANTERVTTELFSFTYKRWLPSISGTDRAELRREVVVRQYNLNDLLDDGDLDNPLPGTATESYVHLKVIEPALWDGRRLNEDGSVMSVGPQPMAPTWRVRVVQTF